MNLLLDTHVVIWWLIDDPMLGRVTRRLVETAGRVFVSPVTPWELEIKRSAGRLTVPDDYHEAITSSGFEFLTITAAHAVAAGQLPLHHRDPFDRMLVAQARTEGLRLVSADRQLAPYEVELVDPRT